MTAPSGGHTGSSMSRTTGSSPYESYTTALMRATGAMTPDRPSEQLRMATRSRADGYGVLRESESGVRYGELQMSRWIYNTATSFDGYIADGENSLDWLFAVEREGAEDTS